MSDSPLLVGTPTLAKLLRVTDRTVRRLSAEGVLPRAGSGPRDGFDLRVCVPKYLAQLQAQGSGSLTEARKRLVEAQRREIEAKTRRREGELLERADVERTVVGAMTTIATQLDGLAGRLCGELAGLTEPAVIRQRLFDECRRIRNAAAAELELLADPESRGAGAAGATTEES
jgi:DNA-binding transcriptional MerR regulator